MKADTNKCAKIRNTEWKTQTRKSPTKYNKKQNQKLQVQQTQEQLTRKTRGAG